MYKSLQLFMISVFVVLMLATNKPDINIKSVEQKILTEDTQKVEIKVVYEEPILSEEIIEETYVEVEQEKYVKPLYKLNLSEEEIYLVAWLAMGEAEGECEEGQRLVIDSVLNRIDSEHFPNTATEVIYQPSQYSCMWNGRIDNCTVTNEMINLVKEELVTRTNYDVIFFTAGNYSKYGVRMFQLGNHYFSRYN